MIELTNSLARVRNYNSPRQKIGKYNHLQKCLLSICEIGRICEGSKLRKTLQPLPFFLDAFLMVMPQVSAFFIFILTRWNFSDAAKFSLQGCIKKVRNFPFSLKATELVGIAMAVFVTLYLGDSKF